MKQSTAVKVLAAGHNVFLTGAPGAGKTHLLNRFIRYLRDREVPVAITAPTGIAATHIGGITLHSWSGLGIREDINEDVIENLLKKSYLRKRFEKTKVLIIDEISMLSPRLFEAVDALLQNIRFSNEPFGGIQVVCTGDFFQLPPVVKPVYGEAEDFSQDEDDIPPKFVWQTRSWQNLEPTVCYLSERHRHDDPDFIRLLDEMRAGKVSEDSRGILEECKFTEFFDVLPTRLFTHNADVDRINQQELKKLDEKEHQFGAVKKGNPVMSERLLENSLVMPILTLKKGARVLFIKNNFEKGFVNGTLGTIIDFDKDTGAPLVRTFEGKEILAEAEEWSIIDEANKKLASVAQIPLRLAWAITVHKSQGMTLDAAEVDLGKAFEPGHGYVALSRVKNLLGLKLLDINQVALQVDPLVRMGDKEMRESSYGTEEMFANASVIEKYPPLSEARKKEKGEEKVPTIEKTRRLLAQDFSLAEICEERGLKSGTIISHISKLAELEVLPEQAKKLFPKKNIQNQVLTAKKEVEKRGNKEDVTQHGQVSSSAIFRELKGKISYDDIRLSLAAEKI